MPLPASPNSSSACTPVGVLAIAAVAAGTLGADTFVRLEVYFVAFAVASLLLAFAVLPLTATAVTPFSYREVVGIAKGALLTAFVTNSVFIVLPMLVERSKELMQRHGLLNAEAASSAEVVVPILFNFPNAGRLLTLLFLPYAAWSVGSPLHVLDYPRLFFVGLFSYFAKARVALPFLMDLLAIPHDLFQLYIPTTIVTGKFDSLVSAMNLLVFALLGAGATTGFLVLDSRRIARAVILVVAWSAAAVVGTRLLLGSVIAPRARCTVSACRSGLGLVAVSPRVCCDRSAAGPVQGARWGGGKPRLCLRPGQLHRRLAGDPASQRYGADGRMTTGRWDGAQKGRSRAGRSCATFLESESENRETGLGGSDEASA